MLAQVLSGDAFILAGRLENKCGSVWIHKTWIGKDGNIQHYITFAVIPQKNSKGRAQLVFLFFSLWEFPYHESEAVAVNPIVFFLIINISQYVPA